MTEPKSAGTRQARRMTGREPELMALEARRILRAEMTRHGFTYKMLAEALARTAGGEMEETVQSLTNKVNRGRFSFAFYLRAIQAMTGDKPELPIVKVEAADHEHD